MYKWYYNLIRGTEKGKWKHFWSSYSGHSVQWSGLGRCCVLRMFVAQILTENGSLSLRFFSVLNLILFKKTIFRRCFTVQYVTMCFSFFEGKHDYCNASSTGVVLMSGALVLHNNMIHHQPWASSLSLYTVSSFNQQRWFVCGRNTSELVMGWTDLDHKIRYNFGIFVCFMPVNPNSDIPLFCMLELVLDQLLFFVIKTRSLV